MADEYRSVPRTIVISPHFDDAALSLGGTLQSASGPITVVTVHGGAPGAGKILSEWDEDCGFLDPAEAFATRVAEDAGSCLVLGAEQHLLPNPDGPYGQGTALAGLDELLEKAAVTTHVYLPLGINQPDHRFVRDRALSALTRSTGPRPRFLFYADLPYAAAAPGWGQADEEGAALERCPEAGSALREIQGSYGLRLASRLHVVGKAWAVKRQAVLCHASQLSLVGAMDEVAHTGPLLGSAGPLRFELTWEVDAWPAPQ